MCSLKLMKNRAPRKMPIGIELLRYFYLLTALLSGLHLLLFLPHTDILWLNSILPAGKNLVISSILILIPLLLFYGFKYQVFFIWLAAFAYHIFFTLNSFLGTIYTLWNNFPLKPIIKITGKGTYSATLENDATLKLFTVFNLNLFMGIIILWYLWRKRGYFRKKTGKD